MESVQPVLEMRNITRRFPGVLALSDVSLDVRPGEVLALMGENGAGKSTLMKILSGALQPDSGELLVEGKRTVLHNVGHAKRLGIILVHQELMLAPNLDIASNIFLGAEPRRAGAILRRQMHEDAQRYMDAVGLTCPSTRPVGNLSAGQMQMVEIAKALSLQPRVLILDEPTSSLTLHESLQLFSIIGRLRREGIAIVYISHRMDEVEQLADRVVVLRDGQRVGEMLRAQATREKIVGMMVGRQLTSWYPPPRDSVPTDISFTVDGLLVPGTRQPVSFNARRGEVLGFAGLVGSGRTELMQTLFGITPARRGTMTLGGKRYWPRRPADAIAAGVYLAPEDRKRHGLVLIMNVAQNVTLPGIGSYRPAGWLQRGQERTVAQHQVQNLRVKTSSIRQRVIGLSGGNQQKVVLAKWLAMRPQLLILDEPTRGVDVGAKSEIYQQIMTLANAGITVLMVSSDMEEVLALSDRVAVMYNRTIKALLPRESATRERVAAIMTGMATSEGVAA